MAVGEDKFVKFRQDLEEFEASMDELKRQYDMFFAGVMKRQPFELRGKVDAMARRMRNVQVHKLELSFRFNTLQAKYNKYCELWEKIFKRRESDPHAVSPYGPTREQLVAEMGRLREQRQMAKEIRAAKGADPMRGLFNSYLDAKKDLGEGVDKIRFDAFEKQLAKQREAIMAKTGAKDVEFKVTRKNGKVSLTARPVKD